MRTRVFYLSLLFIIIPYLISAQNFSSDYIYGEGVGESEQEADQRALASLATLIDNTVVAEAAVKDSQDNQLLNKEFDYSVSTQTLLTLSNTKKLIDTAWNKPGYHVYRYINAKKYAQNLVKQGYDFVKIAKKYYFTDPTFWGNYSLTDKQIYYEKCQKFYINLELGYLWEAYTKFNNKILLAYNPYYHAVKDSIARRMAEAQTYKCTEYLDHSQFEYIRTTGISEHWWEHHTGPCIDFNHVYFLSDCGDFVYSFDSNSKDRSWKDVERETKDNRVVTLTVYHQEERFQDSVWVKINFIIKDEAGNMVKLDVPESINRPFGLHMINGGVPLYGWLTADLRDGYYTFNDIPKIAIQKAVGDEKDVFWPTPKNKGKAPTIEVNGQEVGTAW